MSIVLKKLVCAKIISMLGMPFEKVELYNLEVGRFHHYLSKMIE